MNYLGLSQFMQWAQKSVWISSEEEKAAIVGGGDDRDAGHEPQKLGLVVALGKVCSC